MTVLGYVGLAPSTARPTAAPGNLFSAQRAGNAMAQLLHGIGSHPAGSPAADQLRSRIVDHLRALGYQPELQTTFAVGKGGVAGTVRNVIARSSGREPGPALVCVAHYDSVWAGPGVSDDLSGVGVLLELARIHIEGRRTRQPVVFLFTDAEEQGLVGASAFMDHLLCQDVGLVLNFEARGGSGLAYMFETGPQNESLVRMYADCVSRPTASSLSTEIYRHLPNDTDFSFFRDGGLPGFNFAFIEDLHVYHTPLDDFEHLSLDSLQHEGDQALELMKRWLGQVPPPASSANVICTSLPGNWMILYGQTTGRVVSLLCLLALAWGAQGCVLRARATWAEVRGGFVLAAASVLVGCVTAVSWSSALRSLIGTPRPWDDQPYWCLGIQIGVAICTWTILIKNWGASVGRVGAVLGMSLGWGFAALGSSLFLPGASFLFTLPAVFLTAVLYLIPRDVYLQSRLARGLGGILPLAALVWISAQRGIAEAVGPGVELALALPILVLGTFFMPLLIGIPHWVRRVLASSGVLILLGSSMGTLLAPSQSILRPAKLNLVYAQDVAGTGRAQWQAWTSGSPLPDEFAQHWGFSEVEPQENQDELDPEQRLLISPGWAGRRLFSAPAPHLGLELPRLELDPGAWVGKGEALAWRATGTLHAHGIRGRTTVTVLEAPGPVSLVAHGVSLGVREHFTFMDVPDQGLAIELWVGPPEAQEIEGQTPGRQADSADTGDGALHLRLVHRGPGLPASAAHLLAARPAGFVPAGDGDGILLSGRFDLTLPAVPAEDPR